MSQLYVGAMVGIVYGPKNATNAPMVRRKPLDQCGRVITYWHGNRSLAPQIFHLPAFG